MKRGLFIVPFLYLLLSLSVTYSATYYVDGSMLDDKGDGKSWATAKKFIASGISLMSKGDTLRIKSGTYNEALNIQNKDGTSWTAGNYYYVRSDDGNGNYGSVVIGGNVSIKGGISWFTVVNAGNFILSSDYWWFDGITFTSTSVVDCGLYVTNVNAGSEPYAKGNGFRMTNCIVNGNPRKYLFQIWEMNDIAIIGCTFVSTGCRGHADDGCMICIGSYSNPNGSNAVKGVTFQQNSITGTYKAEYGALWLRNCTVVDVSRNYFYNLSNNHVCARWGDQGNHKYYNNVHILGGSNHQPNESQHIYWFRGMTTTAYGGNGGPSVYDGHIYNNTIDMNGVTSGYTWALFLFHDDTTRAIVQNNLIIGNVPNSVESIIGNYDEGGDSANNVARNNVVTGTISCKRGTGWFYDYYGRQSWTLSNNISGVGTAFINLSGNIPSPYYRLKASYDGSGTGITITTDFDGNIRNLIPDVGAFEAPSISPPQGLRIMRQ